MKSRNKLFLFLLLSMTLVIGQFGRLQIIPSVSITLIDSAVLLILLNGFIKKNTIQFLRKDFLFKPFVFFITVCILSLVINSSHLQIFEVIVSFLYLLRWVMYLLLYFFVKNSSTQFKKNILYGLLGTGFILVIAGYLQYAFFNNLHSLYYLGWDEHMHRMFSTFLDPNFAGIFYTLYFLLISGILSKQITNKNKIYTYVLLFISLIALLAIFLTFSRSAFLSLLVGFAVLLVLVGRKKVFLYLLCAFVVFFLVTYHNFYIENINLFRIASSEARIKSAEEALVIIKDNPVVGVGFNAYKYAQLRYGFRNSIGIQISHADGSTDNSFLFVLATSGVIGFIAYLYVWYMLCKKVLIQRDKTINCIIVASLSALFVDSLFINSLFFMPILAWIWILVGLMDYR